MLILNKYVRPTALDRWLETFEIIEDDWKVIFKQPYLSARETKLQSIQYKILHRIIPCRKWLYKQKVIDSQICNQCNENEVDDILHHFIKCSRLQNFWHSIELWWNRKAEYQIVLTNKHIIFGFYYDNANFSNINYIILLAKWYIQSQTYYERQIDFLGFLTTLKQHLLTEKYICTCNDKLNLFDKKWSKILENL